MAKKETDKKTASTPAAAKKKAAKKITPIKKSAKKKAAKRTVTASAAPAKKKSVKKIKASADEKRMMVAMHAYYKWENAGRPDNAETQLWFDAEKEIEAMLK